MQPHSYPPAEARRRASQVLRGRSNTNRGEADTRGVEELSYMRKLFVHRKWYDLVPDQTHTVTTTGYDPLNTSGHLLLISAATGFPPLSKDSSLSSSGSRTLDRYRLTRMLRRLERPTVHS